MPDFATMKSKLADWLGASNTARFPDSVRGDLINGARRELSRLHDLRFGEVSDTFATVAAQRDYALPTGWSRPHTFWYQHPDHAGIVFPVQLSKERFDLNFPDATKTGLPTAYTVWAGSLQLGPTPDRVLTINRNYFRVLADLVQPTDEDDLMREAWEVVLYRALVEASAYLLEDPRIPTWARKATDLEHQLIIEHSRARHSGGRVESREPS